METLEGNKIIAEFDGYKLHPNDQLNGIKGVYRKKDKMPMLPTHFKYHTSWDWQIPAWSKVAKAIKETLKDNIGTEFSIYMGLVNRYETAVFNNEPQEGFLVITDAIQWYNSTKKDG